MPDLQTAWHEAFQSTGNPLSSSEAKYLEQEAKKMEDAKNKWRESSEYQDYWNAVNEYYDNYEQSYYGY